MAGEGEGIRQRRSPPMFASGAFSRRGKAWPERKWRRVMSSTLRHGIRVAALLGTVCLATHAQAQSSLSIPKPDPEFKGKVGETLKDSIPSYPPPLKAPQSAPNVLVILLDDVGFGHPSTFGGPVPTPTL